MTPEERELLIAAVTTAHRERAPEIRAHRAFHDLDEAARMEAFDETLLQRKLEAASSDDGLTSTARAVLARLG
jgi:hypothetical protein